MATVGTSNLDVNSLVTQLVAAERAPMQARLTRVDAKLTTQFTALSQLKGSLSGFQSALSGLKDAGNYLARSASVSDTKYFSASASSSASVGTYDIEVVKLAKAAKLTSGTFAGGATTVVGTGTLTLTMGSASVDVTIDSSNNTLAGIRDAINKATGNPGVQATLITGTGGSKLVLTGSKIGVANAVTVSSSGGNGGLSALTDPLGSPTTALTTTQAAQDAQILVSGFAATSTTNTFDKAIDGVTLTLLKEEPGTTTTLTVANDTGTVQNRVNSFVTAFNSVAKQISTLRSYDPATQNGGPMLGDAMLQGIESQLRRLIAAPVTGANAAYTSLASLGITTQLDGTLSLNATKFQAAMAAGPSMVSGVFGGAEGIATKLYDYLTAQLASTGQIAARDSSIAAQRKSLTAQTAALDVRMAAVQVRYKKQFSTLDSLLTKMQGTSDYLSQQLANLNVNNNK
ncbi:MAG: hypothetical protein RLZZ200_259 [Pseudomonadota bacterium]|jgi:flagellar hook-associated protein 2